MEIGKELLEMRGKGKKEKLMAGAKGLGNNRMPLFELIFKRCRENINTEKSRERAGKSGKGNGK